MVIKGLEKKLLSPSLINSLFHFFHFAITLPSLCLQSEKSDEHDSLQSKLMTLR